MPPLETADRRQKALLWMASGADKYGRTKVNAYVQIDVRWNTTRRTIVDAQGNTVALDAQLVVDRKISPGSVLWLGEAADYLGTGSGSGLADTEHYEVVDYREAKDLKGRHVRREVGLMRYRDALPTLTG